jgi:hypothetical protein
MDLVAAIEHASAAASSNVYWGWDQQKRGEYKSYHAALNTEPDIGGGDDDDGDDASECEPEVPSENEEEPEEESATARVDVQEGDTAEPPPPPPPQHQQQPAVRKKNSRWIDYTQIAREELRQSTGRQKVPQKEVFALARKYYVEDGWAK